jgi:hypothetical protein
MEKLKPVTSFTISIIPDKEKTSTDKPLSRSQQKALRNSQKRKRRDKRPCGESVFIFTDVNTYRSYLGHKYARNGSDESFLEIAFNSGKIRGVIE